MQPPLRSGPLDGQPELMPTAAAVPIDPNHGRVQRIGAQSATHDSVKLTPAQLAILDGPNAANPPSQNPRAHAPTDSPYPVHAAGRPFMTDLAPSDVPNPAPQVPRSGSHNLNKAANLMSPVGEHFQPHDWAAAAAAPAKALTRVQLALLFVAAVAGALLVTMVIAKIIH
jgi:hypothetical protein